MLSFIFVVLMLLVFGKLISFAFRAAWGLTKIVLFLILLPVILVLMFFGGLVFLALPILIIVGIISMFVHIL